jgi:hypothetical protein
MNIINKSVNTLNDTSNIFSHLNLDKQDDLNIIHVNAETLDYIYNNNYYDIFNNTTINIFIVDVINNKTIPFLKLADYIIYYNEYQKYTIDHLINLDTIPSTVIPFPILDIDGNTKENKICITGDVVSDDLDKIEHILDSWNSDDADEILIKITGNQSVIIDIDEQSELTSCEIVCYFNVDTIETSKKLYDLINSYEDITAMITINNKDTEKLEDIMSTSRFCYIWNEEISSDKVTETVDKGTDQIFYSDIKENYLLPLALSHKCEVIIAQSASTHNSFNRPTQSEYISTVNNIINTSSKNRILPESICEIDHNTYQSYYNGDNLNNDFIFVINFRNQEHKINRCLESILINNSIHKHSVGILITDDMSTDNSLESIDSFITRYSHLVDIKVVKNKVRKMSSRNLYNAVHHFVSNPESVIIELDGDDFLNNEYNVLDILHEEYSKGSLKTIGEFQSYPTENMDMVINNQKYDLTNPWDHGRCTPWAPLRSYKAHLFRQVELMYFIERDTLEWLKIADDSSINPRMIELADGNISIIRKPLYIYDLTGNRDSDEDYWSPFYSHKKITHAITF